jgi:peroxiredoxin
VVAVVAQRSEKVEEYLETRRLPFEVLVDESRDVVKRYGVWHQLGLDAWNIARPALFLIDRTGRVRFAFVAARQDEFPSYEEIIAQLSMLEP